MKAIQWKPHKIDLSPYLLDIFWAIDLYLISLNTSRGINSIPKEPKYTAVLLSINNKTQSLFLLFYHQYLRHMLHL